MFYMQAILTEVLPGKMFAAFPHRRLIEIVFPPADSKALHIYSFYL